MKLALGFRHKLSGNLDIVEGKYSLYPVRQQFDQLKARIVAGWNIEHKPDGSHGAITADSVDASGTIDAGGLMTAAAGLVFSARSTNTSALDQYAEASWTPTLGGSSGTSGQAYAVRNGQVIKIGKLVVCFCHINLTTAGTVTGDAQISGLPYTTQSDTPAGVGYFPWWANFTTSVIFKGGIVNATATTMTLYQATAATGTSAIMPASQIVDGCFLQGVIVYLAAT